MNKHAPIETPRYRNQAAQRVLAVLSAFAAADGSSRGVTELARTLGMNKNMVHRALSTLCGEGFLTRDPSGERYQLGYRVLDISGGAEDEFDLRSVCRPTLEQLHTLTGESVFLSIVVGTSRVNIDWIEARGRRVSHGQRGRSVPLHCTRMSRALLAFLSDAEIEAYLRAAAPLDRFDAVFPETAGEGADAVWRDVHEIRARGYIVWQNPQQYSAAYVAFPLLDPGGRPHGIVTVGGPWERFDPEQIRARLPAIQAVLDPLRQQCRLYPAAPIFVAGAEAA
jgi:DNA-binding IclR family transcriptional regulator